MKKKLISIVFSVFMFSITYQVRAKSLYNFTYTIYDHYQQQIDTIKYLRENINNFNDRYKNRKLEDFLTSINLRVISYTVNLARKPGGVPTGIMLYFEEQSTARDKVSDHKQVPSLMVNLEGGVDAKKALVLYMKTGGKWSSQEETLYGTAIITSLRIAGDK